MGDKVWKAFAPCKQTFEMESSPYKQTRPFEKATIEAHAERLEEIPKGVDFHAQKFETIV